MGGAEDAVMVTAYLTDPISSSGGQVEPVPKRFHLCGARCCQFFILFQEGICCLIIV